MEPRTGAVRKEKQAQSQTSTTHHSAGSYFPGTTVISFGMSYPTTPADVAPPSPPGLAQPGYHKAQMGADEGAQTEHARAELMKEVRKLRYNDLVVEG